MQCGRKYAVNTKEAQAKFLIVEEEPNLLARIRSTLVAAGFSVTAFASVKEFLASMDQLGVFDCIIADFEQSGEQGIEVMKAVTRRFRDTPVLILIAHGDISSAVSAIKHGAVDVVEKPFTARRIGEAFGLALQTRQKPALTVNSASNECAIRNLTPRQLAVLELLAQGFTSKEIAVHLGMSHDTASKHRASIMHKLKVRSRAELVRLKVIAEQSQTGGRT